MSTVPQLCYVLCCVVNNLEWNHSHKRQRVTLTGAQNMQAQHRGGGHDLDPAVTERQAWVHVEN